MGNFSVWEVFIPKYYWVSIIGWLTTILVIKTYIKGMEGNVMGFIFFPLVLVSCLLLIGVNAFDLFSVENQDNLMLNGPQVDLSLWVRIPLHVFLPIYIVLFLKTKSLDDESETHWVEPLLSSLIFQMVFLELVLLRTLTTMSEKLINNTTPISRGSTPQIHTHADTSSHSTSLPYFCIG